MSIEIKMVLLAGTLFFSVPYQLFELFAVDKAGAVMFIANPFLLWYIIPLGNGTPQLFFVAAYDK